MAEIKNYTLDFGCGRPLRGLDFAFAKSASAEVQRGSWFSTRGVNG
jgi:hypothetical protein